MLAIHLGSHSCLQQGVCVSQQPYSVTRRSHGSMTAVQMRWWIQRGNSWHCQAVTSPHQEGDLSVLMAATVYAAEFRQKQTI